MRTFAHSPIDDEYLGDGVYASFDGWHVWLDLRAQGNERIALEPNIIKALVRFAKHAHEANKQTEAETA